MIPWCWAVIACAVAFGCGVCLTIGLLGLCRCAEKGDVQR